MQAYYDVLHRTPRPIEYDGKISELFGENVFHADVMREYLPSEAYKSMMEAIQNGTRLERKMADLASVSFQLLLNTTFARGALTKR